jgi:succinate dehydrogenase / fumarate reductase, cytochrome b subunit
MSNFFTSSIGRKFIISLTGVFLMMFIVIHLTINLMLIVDDSGKMFNLGANFMSTNPVIQIIEPVLGLGFIIHILFTLITTYQNWKARPIPYNKKDETESSTWASRNMFILGGLIFVFLVVHIINFFWVIHFNSGKIPDITIGTKTMEDSYSLVSGLFKSSVLYCFCYIFGAILLGLHLTHGFWSAFQTIGMNNSKWKKRLERVAWIYAIIVAVGFSSIPLYFMIKF